MILNLPVKRCYLTLAHLMNGEPRPMKMLNYLKKMSKDGNGKRIRKQEFNVGDQVLLYNSRLRIFGVKLRSKWE